MRRIKIASKIFDSIRTVLASGPSDSLMQETLDKLRKLSEEKKIPIAIVRGLATIKHGYPTTTQDVDINISTKDDEQFIRYAPSYGFKVEWASKKGWHTLTYKGVEINVVPEGGKAHIDAPTTIPNPPYLGVNEGLDYANLEGWVELKVSAGRSKDQSHVIEVLKRLPKDSIERIKNHLTQVHESYLEKFLSWLDQAEREKIQESQTRG